MSDTMNDTDFVRSMHDLLGMDKDAVDKLLDDLDTDELQDLTDAVAKKDRDAAKRIVGRFNTDEEINSLFRGEHLKTSDDESDNDDVDSEFANTPENEQYGIGDDVKVRLRDKHNKPYMATGTVANPTGPEGSDTIVVRIKGNIKVINKSDARKINEDGMIGMMGMPNLNRVQQLAGIQATQPANNLPPEIVLPNQSPQDDSTSQAMCALDNLEQALPDVKLVDLKCIRQRLAAIQQLLNEGSLRASVIPKKRL